MATTVALLGYTDAQENPVALVAPPLSASSWQGVRLTSARNVNYRGTGLKVEG